MSDPIAIDDIELYDRLTPSIHSGNYEIAVSQTVDGVDTGSLGATQKVTVSAPQFALPPGEVVQLNPPAGATGRFGGALPFAVLAEPALPWERKMPADEEPWLAVLVFGPGELRRGDPVTGRVDTTVAELEQLSDVLVPSFTRDPATAGNQPCSYVEVPAAVFTTAAPRRAELPLLAHVRRVGGGDGNGERTLSVVTANRLPADAPAAGGAVTNVAHLVSLEGLTQYLVADPVYTRSGKTDGTRVFDALAVVSLASWSFEVQPVPATDFAGAMVDLLDAEYAPSKDHHAPERLWLRLPAPPPEAGDGAAVEAAAARLEEGFVPLAYHARSGEDAWAWYRGPLTPVPTAPLDKAQPFASADAAMTYDAAHGVFDLSLSAAWQAGRAAALADPAFGRALLDLRRRLHTVADRVADRRERGHFDADEDLAALAEPDALLRRLPAALPATVLAEVAGGGGGEGLPAADPGPAREPAAALASLLSGDGAPALLALAEERIDPVAQWLDRLSMLEGVPFEHLVADPRMLPVASHAADPGAERPLVGSVRFFHLDANWIGALRDGAMSVGVESSRHALLGELAASATGAPAGPRSGVLLRSPVVAGWPSLVVRPEDAQGRPLRTLRRALLAPGVLMCIFEGVPARVAIGQPREGLHFGLDDDGAVELRNLVPPSREGDRQLGEPLGRKVTVRGSFTRADGRALRLVADATGAGLADALAGELGAGPPLGSAALALQLVGAPQELAFTEGARL